MLNIICFTKVTQDSEKPSNIKESMMKSFLTPLLQIPDSSVSPFSSTISMATLVKSYTTPFEATS